MSQRRQSASVEAGLQPGSPLFSVSSALSVLKKPSANFEVSTIGFQFLHIARLP
jgi:hypothetical protein